MRAGLIALVLGFAGTSPAYARDWPSAGGWDIVEGDTYCAIHSEFEGKGDTELSLLLETDGMAFLGVTNSGWSSKEGEKYDLAYVVNGNVYTGGKSTGFGGKYAFKKGFTGLFKSDFVSDFAAGSSIIILRNDVVVDHLDLKGTAAAIAMARRCLAAVERDIAAAEAEKRKYSGIADDPFAISPTSLISSISSGDTAKPQVRGNPQNWFGVSDYPTAALIARVEGRAAFKASVDSSGRVSDCQITSSSGNADLDAKTCQLVIQRGRFSPARNAEGDFVDGEWSGEFKWSLPE